ncbi:MAG TPA: SGNH/GDSL hydrolase family protein [Streptosporangiaceae bacterium]|nr:SGNH/GDSL hydrolase family protein [Streptosporangiaceae bacterium]
MRGPRGRIATSAQRTGAASGIAAFLRTGRSAAAKRLVVCAGDSITSGQNSANWVDLLQRHFAADGYQFVNAGIDGDPAWNVLERIDDVVRCQPDAVTLQVGGNDVAAASGTWHEKLYWRQQHVPHAPTLDWYTECVDEILTRLRSQTSARIAVLDIPMIGEDVTSDMNRRVDSYNQALRRVAAAHMAEYLPLHDRLAALLPSSHSPPPYRGRFGPMIRASLSRNILHRSWDQISASNGLIVLIDHVHLNDRAAMLTSDLVADFITSL